MLKLYLYFREFDCKKIGKEKLKEYSKLPICGPFMLKGEVDEDAPLDDHQIFCGLLRKKKKPAEEPQENAQNEDFLDNTEAPDYDCEQLIRDANNHDWSTNF